MAPTPLEADITSTTYGDVFSASIIRQDTHTAATGDGHLDHDRCITLAIGLSPAGHWMPLMGSNGDWDGVCEDNNDAAINLGRLDPAHATDEQALIAGADLLREWAFQIYDMDASLNNDALDDLGAYLECAADRAVEVAEETKNESNQGEEKAQTIIHITWDVPEAVIASVREFLDDVRKRDPNWNGAELPIVLDEDTHITGDHDEATGMQLIRGVWRVIIEQEQQLDDERIRSEDEV